MTWLALDTSGSRAAVAVGEPGAVRATAAEDGVRVHARALLPLIEEALASAGCTLLDVRQVALTDGPGSFTGIRVGAAVAKALAHRGAVSLHVAPALLAGAAHALQPGGAVVAGVSDALRGEAYLGAWSLGARGIEAVLEPRTVAPGELAGALEPAPVALVGEVPEALAAACRAAWDLDPRPPSDAAVGLLALAALPGGLRHCPDPMAWEPVYGRPAEAQARWEAAHGRPLPAAPGTP